MEILAVLVATPVAIWLIDRIFFRGEFAGAVLEAVNAARGLEEKKKKPRLARRIPS